MKNHVPVSILVPIKNEAENLPRCLECVQWADEIFVVDSQSTDGSIAVAEKLGAKVTQFQFNFAGALTFGWKVLWYHETPSTGTIYWLMKGYNDYFMIHGP